MTGSRRAYARASWMGTGRSHASLGDGWIRSVELAAPPDIALKLEARMRFDLAGCLVRPHCSSAELSVFGVVNCV
jgi:hypothetical protein